MSLPRLLVASVLAALSVLATATSAPADPSGRPFGAPCAKDADCASKVCSNGKKGAYCSIHCASDADCPSPPTAGACNGRGFCKKK